MARGFSQLHHRIWADPTWRALDVDAQHLYLLLISQPQINLAGVLPVQIRRWASCVADWGASTVEKALDRLAHDRFVVVDWDTEEVLVRTMIRSDGGYRTPGILKAILKLAESTQSHALRRCLADELGRLPRLNGRTADASMELIRSARLALMAGAEPIPEPIPDGMADGIPDGLLADGIADGIAAKPMPDGIGDASITGTGTGTQSSSVEEGVGEAPLPRLEDLAEPPPCAKHAGMDREDIPPCRLCGIVRKEWEAACAAAAERSPLLPLCGQCENRWIETDRGLKHCPRCHPAEARR